MAQFSKITAKKLAIETISLSSSVGRLIFFGSATTIIYFSKYEWFSDLSLWQRLGWETAPSIGLTRAYWLVLHGRFEDAWNRNFLIYPIVLLVVTVVVRDIILVRRKQRSKKA